MAFARRLAIPILLAAVVSAACSSAQPGSSSAAPVSASTAGGSVSASPPTEADLGLPSNATFVHTRQADIDGDGVPDLVALYANGPLYQSSTRWTLRVMLATGAIIDKTLDPRGGALCINLPRCEFQSLYNADGVPGDEIFLLLDHISTYNTVSVFKLSDGQIISSGSFWADGGDVDYKFGYSCTQSGGQPVIVQHSFTQPNWPTGRWLQRDQVYSWQGASLVKSGSPSATTLAAGVSPPSNLVGGHCP
jgi:hypothetical protein